MHICIDHYCLCDAPMQCFGYTDSTGVFVPGYPGCATFVLAQLNASMTPEQRNWVTGKFGSLDLKLYQDLVLVGTTCVSLTTCCGVSCTLSNFVFFVHSIPNRFNVFVPHQDTPNAL
jgi:hypothetical protein